MITWLKVKLGLGLTFREAWALALEGRLIRRDAWAEHCSIIAPGGKYKFAWLLYVGHIGFYAVPASKPWQPYAADFTANDWRVL
jgi:hypothetical protein